MSENAWNTRRRTIPRPQVCQPPIPPLPPKPSGPTTIFVQVTITASPEGGDVTISTGDDWALTATPGVYEFALPQQSGLPATGIAVISPESESVIVTVFAQYEGMGGSGVATYVATLPSWNGVDMYIEETLTWEGPGFPVGHCTVEIQP